MKKWFCLVLLLVVTTVYAATGFVVKKIQIKGLEGIPQATVFSYLPLAIGDHVDAKKSTKIIESLYKTGFFENVVLSRKNSTLLIQVKQRPIISRISIKGNKKLSTKILRKVLGNLGFTTGRVFDQSILSKIKHSLIQEYFVIGRYNARVNVKITKEKRNRVAIKILIFEGKVAKIHQIKIIGNHDFKEKKILKQFKLSTPNLLSFFTHDDQYSSQKLEADLESLRSFYMNRGYIKFKIISKQVSVDPTLRQVYIVIHISEGAQYHVSGYRFSGHLILPQIKLKKIVPIKAGQIFSRRKVINAVKIIENVLGDKGYGKAKVNAIPTINYKKKNVYLNFHIIPGRHVYIRYITFSGNYRTNDETLRRNLLQQEGGLFSRGKVEGSKRFLLLLPYIQTAQVQTKPVPGKSNQVDVNYKVKERSASTISAGLGYSQLDKFIIHAALNYGNVLGTGNSLSVSAMRSKSLQSASLDYYNPYYTKYGIGRDISLFANHFNAKKANISDYAMSSYGGSLGYNFRISQNDRLNFSAGYENDILKLGSYPSTQMTRFVKKYHRHFYQILLSAGWTHQGLDRIIFPTRGLMQSAGLTVAAPMSKEHSLEYYKINYLAVYFHPLRDHFIGKLRFHAAYGGGYGRFKRLPFIKNFYAGGMGSVRGYTGNTLGPKDSNGDAMGGNTEVDGTLGLIFPNPISKNIRTTAFFDFGNVYGGKPALNMRLSEGIQVDWLSPLGLLHFSLAKALNAHKSDDTNVFQFNIGTSF